MPVKNRRMKKQEKSTAALWEAASGIRLYPGTKEPGMRPAAVCICRALLIFSCLFGTIGCYTSCFEIPFDTVLTGVFLFLISFYAAFLYYNRLTLNLGYILLLLAFAAAAVHLRSYAGSGFNAIINITYDAIDEKYALPAVRHFPEQIGNRYAAVTVSLLFIGTFFAILLNCLLSGSRPFFKVFICIFPFIFIGLYFDRMPSMPYTMLTGFGLAATLSIKWGKRQVLDKRGKTKAQNAFLHRFHNGHRFHSAFRTGHLSIAAACFLFAGVILIPTAVIVPESLFTAPSGLKALRDYTDTRVRTFMISGFSGLTNRYAASGGVSGGKLGGISSIRPDFETDLIVDLVPYHAGPVYLKAFTAGDYKGDHWEPAALCWDPSGSPETSAIDEADANRESLALARRFEKKAPGAMKAKMRITNKGANSSYLYLPYYSLAGLREGGLPFVTGYKMGLVSGSSPLNQPYEVTYYPYVPDYTELPASSSIINDLTAQLYLQIPASVKPELSLFCMQNQLLDASPDASGLADRINACFSSSMFSYSMDPGATPKKKDFVLWFLQSQKKGFCTHFASAATLIYRLNGIPARYVEGYSIPYQRILDSNLVRNASYEDWFQGDSPLGKTAVVEAEVNDSMAHAWVEIYQEGRGWLPVDVTPPSGAEEESGSSFWDLFTGIFSSQTDSGGGNSQAFTGLNTHVSDALHNAGRILLLLLACALSIFVLLSVLRKVSRSVAAAALMCLGRYNEAVMNDYRLLSARLYKKKLLSGTNLTCRACFTEIKASLKPQKEAMEKWEALVEEAGYSPRCLCAKEALFCRRFTRSLKRLARRQPHSH